MTADAQRMAQPKVRAIDPSVSGIADYCPAANHRAQAIRGSLKLRNALFKMIAPKPVKSPPIRRQRWSDRKRYCAHVARIRFTVAEYFGLSVADMLSRRGKETLCRQRQIAMYLSRECTKASYPDIGKMFGGRDHTTVMFSYDRIAEALTYDLRVRADVDHLRRTLAG